MIALFDLDNTLIAGDSDHAWGQFAVAKGLVDAKEYARKNDAFYADYERGELDVRAYLRFALEPLSHYSLDQLAEFHREFTARYIQPMWLPKAEALIQKHRDLGHRLVVITSTNRFVVESIVTQFGIADLICSEPEIRHNRYTGDFIEEPCFREGKIDKLKRWLQQQNEDINGAWFYSDSLNDLPLLEYVDNPVAVDPDATLRQQAEVQGWPIMSLR